MCLDKRSNLENEESKCEAKKKHAEYDEEDQNVPKHLYIDAYKLQSTIQIEV